MLILGPGAALGASTSYDSARVAAHVQMLAQTIGDRAAGTAGESQAAAYIAAQFVRNGLNVQVLSFPIVTGAGASTSSNVIATKPGLDPNFGVIYIGAHYDSVPNGPGANDNASGTALLIEIGRLLAEQELKPTVVLVAFGAEEIELRGSSVFVRELTPMQRIMALGMLNMDCTGYGAQHTIATTADAPTGLIERAAHQATLLGIDPQIEFNSGQTDHIPFAAAGIPAVSFATRDDTRVCGPYYHQPSDTVATLDFVQMERVGQVVLATIMELAATAPLRSPTTLWFPVAALDPVEYPAATK